MKTILAGGGHGHVYVMAQMRRQKYPGQIMLISDHNHQYYSGMLSDYIAGNYTYDDVSFNLEDLAKKTGIHFVNEKIIQIDGERKIVITENGKYSYDILSMDLGSKTYPICNSLTVKPLTQLLEIKQRIEDKEISSLAILGGGASGVELAFAYDILGKKLDYPLKITILENNKIIPDFPQKARNLIIKEITNRGMILLEDKIDFKEGDIYLSTGERIKADLILQATGPKPNNIQFTGFTIHNDGYILADKHLRTSQDNTFAMGDMIHFEPKNLPKVGVYAIRQSPILCHNLYVAAKGGKLKEFKPQKNYLGIISLGNRKAVAKWRGFTLQGKRVFKWKSFIDKKFMSENKV